jgi:hypothetical protein
MCGWRTRVAWNAEEKILVRLIKFSGRWTRHRSTHYQGWTKKALLAEVIEYAPSILMRKLWVEMVYGKDNAQA